METLPNNSTSLELTMAIPGFFSSSSSSSSGEIKVVEINACNINKGFMEELEEDHDESPINGSPARRKKLRLTKRQSLLLEQSFAQNQTLNPKERVALAMHLKLSARQVEVWFQNRRARRKLKQTEVECEYLKRWFESLREQNMTLHKEMEELKAVKLADPPHGSHASAWISALTMCPRCERITTSTASCLYKGSTTTSMAAIDSPFVPFQNHYASPYN